MEAETLIQIQNILAMLYASIIGYTLHIKVIPLWLYITSLAYQKLVKFYQSGNGCQKHQLKL